MAKKDNYIMYDGKRYDIEDWTTPAKKAAKLQLHESTIRQRVHRTRIGKPGNKAEPYVEIPELSLILVKKV